MPTGPPELLDKSEVLAASLAAKLRAAGLPEQADKVDRCGRDEACVKCAECGRVRFFAPTCNWRFCPRCGRKIAAERAAQVRLWAAQLRQPKHVVVTVRNTHAITRHYVRAFSKCLTLLRRTRWPHPWQAGTWTIEVTNEGRGFHVHAHLLVETRFIPAAQLARRWAGLVGQEFAIVKVTDARAEDYAREVAKYVVKPEQVTQWPPHEIRAVVTSFNGTRVFGVFGSLFKAWKDYRREVRELRREATRCECGANCWRFADPILENYTLLKARK